MVSKRHPCFVFSQVIRSLAFSLFAMAASQYASAQRSELSLDAQHWIPHPEARQTKPATVSFVTQEGFPQGLVTVSEGSIEFRGLDFVSGTIDFDMKVTGDGLPGIRFRLQGDGSTEVSEEVYLRPSSDCRASNDCVQYAPVINGFMLWNVFPEYQSQAPIFDGWNHFKLVVSGQRMKMYVNHFPEPVLTVGKLESGSSHGTLVLIGPAEFANVAVRSGQVEGLPPSIDQDSSDTEPSIVRSWELGSPSPVNFGASPVFADAPAQNEAWKSVKAERFGFVNLNRIYRSEEVPSEITWLRFEVWSDKSQTKTLSLGWIGQIWIFLNGSFTATEKNFYYPDSERQKPDGRYSLDNGSIPIDLQPGRNVITFAVYNSIRDSTTSRTKYGWGMGARFTDLDGIRF